MKNLYTLLGSAALVLASTVQVSGQSAVKPSTVAGRTVLCAPGHTPGHHTNADTRGTAPVNDACSSVTVQTLPLGGSLTLTGDNTGATDVGDYEPGSGLETFGPVVWHKFSISGCANLTLAYCGTNPAYQNLAAFLARTCPATDADYVLYSTGNFTDCGDGNGTIFFTAVPAGTYYLPVLLDEVNAAVGPYTIQLSAEACAVAPANDECAGAIPLSVNSWCSPSYFDGNGATQSIVALLCNGYTGNANDDVWFSFVATAADMTISVQGQGDTLSGYDAVMELFSGTCGSLSSIACSDAAFYAGTEQLEANGLSVGTTYYVRVYDYYNGYPANTNFGICVVPGIGINIGVNEVAAAAQPWSIYPNPGAGLFNLNYNGVAGNTAIEVVDLTGRVVFSELSQLNQGATHTIDLSGLAAGNYTVRLTAGGVRSEQRLMVK